MSASAETRLTVASSDEVIARLEVEARARPQDRGVVAFDADGTLWSGDIGVDTFEALLEERAIRPEAGDALREEARGSRIALGDDPNEQARILYEAFQRDAYSEERAFAMMAWVFAGYLREEVRVFAASVVQRVALRDRLHGEVLPVIRWARAVGVPLYVVSASPALVVEAAVGILGLPFEDIFAMEPAIHDDRIAPRILEPVTYGAGKTAALERGVPGVKLLGAFGDSVFDLAMLGTARVPVAVRPKPELRRRGTECPGLVELLPRDP